MHSEAWHQLIRDDRPLKRHPDLVEAFDRAAARLEAAHMGYLLPFFARLAATYARWADDLPGSERYHHARPFGLLIHAAETVDWAFAIRGNLMESFRPVWHEVLLTLALLHDCGRLFDVDIPDPCHGDSWDPTTMPLHLFRETRFISPTDPVRWRPGRGIQTHEDRFFDLVPVLVDSTKGIEFISGLSHAWTKYLDRRRPRGMIHDFYPYAVAQVVASADQQSVRQDLLRQKAPRHPPPGPSNAPVCCYSSPPLMRSPFPGGSLR